MIVIKEGSHYKKAMDYMNESKKKIKRLSKIKRQQNELDLSLNTYSKSILKPFKIELATYNGERRPNRSDIKTVSIKIENKKDIIEHINKEFKYNGSLPDCYIFSENTHSLPSTNEPYGVVWMVGAPEEYRHGYYSFMVRRLCFNCHNHHFKNTKDLLI